MTILKTVGKTIKNHLWAKVVLGLVLGGIVGVLMGPDLALLPANVALETSNWLAFAGYLFLAIIKMIVIPLVVSSIICGIASSGSIEIVEKLGLNIVLYFIATTTVAVSVGVFLAYLFNPGAHIDPTLLQSVKPLDMGVSEALVDTSNIPKRIASLIPTNPIDSMASSEMLQIVIFAAFIGAALVFLPKKKSKPLLDVIVVVQETCMVIVEWTLKLAPYAVFGLVAQLLIQMGLSALSGMLFYVITVLSGLVCILVFYGFILSFYSRRSPLEFWKQIRNAQLIAFSTSSSSATMPVTLKTAEENANINPTVSGFVVPLGATINMDGTAMYQTIATVFLAQAFHLDLTFTDILLVLVTAIAASVGTPGTPGVGIVVLATILTTVGLPVEGIAIILGVDRILDMCRTTINVTGDLVACTVMEKLLLKKLPKNS